ncbi:MAG: hypothetical protein AB1938_31400 [Myxococcota bacterium]
MTSLALLLLLNAGPTTWGLRWAAPPECRQAADVSRAVEDKLHRPVFGAEPAVLVDGVVERFEGDWRARISLVDAQGTVLGTREVTSRESACASLDDKVTLVVALLIDPSAALGPPPVLPPAPAPALPPPPPTSPAGLFPSERKARLLVESDAPPLEVRRVVHQGIAEGGAHASRLTGITTICSEPCDVPVTPGEGYFVVGDGVLTSARFEVPDAPSVLLKVTTASTARLIWAATAATVGLLATLGCGVAALLVRENPPATGALVGCTAAGVVSMSLGFLFGLGLKTEVDVVPGGQRSTR